MSALIRVWISILVAAFAFTGNASAQSFPEREVIVVVTWSPGGRTDVGVRTWAPHLAERLGVPAVVDNRVGGGGLTGARTVLDDPDGYTIGVLSASQLNAQWTRIPPFELDKYTPVALIYNSPFVLSVRTDSGISTLEEFLEKGRSEQITFGVAGAGASDHIGAAVFANAAGIQARFVPYEGDAGATAALMGGEVDAIMIPLPGIMQVVRSGEFKPLAVSQESADSLHQDIPTFREQGVDFVLGDFGGAVFVSGDTSEEVVSAWQDALRETMELDAVKEGLASLSIVPNYVEGEAFQALLDEWNPRLEAAIEGLGLKLVE